MKSFIFAILILVLIIVGTSYYSYSLENAVERLERQLTEAETYIEASDWENGRKTLSGLSEDWLKTQSWLKAIINHKAIDQVDQTICEVLGYAQFENEEETLVKTSVLRMILQNIPLNESVSLVNIL